jgi:protein-tyrosine phosphatase
MSPLMSGEPRRLSIPGTANLRDVGGYDVAGGATRWRTLFRADALHGLGGGGRAALVELGVRTVIDLREPVERTQDPDDLAGLPISVHNEPLLLDVIDVNHIRTLEQFYRDIVDLCGHRFARVVSLLAADDGMPAVVHCSAGKDRTGLVFAILLSALGASDDTIVADYALTARFIQPHDRADLVRRVGVLGLDEQVLAVNMGAPPEAMRGVLEHLRLHGGAREYLLSHGLSPDALAQLRHRLLN